MHRPGADPANMQATDFLCDFCASHWQELRPMVEGHRGSLICGPCLTLAYGAVVQAGLDDAPQGADCTMCLELRRDGLWRSPLRTEAAICRRCIELAARRLARDPECSWTVPTATG